MRSHCSKQGDVAAVDEVDDASRREREGHISWSGRVGEGGGVERKENTIVMAF